MLFPNKMTSQSTRTPLMAQMVKNPPAMQKTCVQYRSQERSSGEGNDNLLQDSHLENSMDRGAWQATVNGVTKNETGLND